MKDTLKLCALYVLMILLVTWLASCSTTKKSKSVTKTTVDSSVIAKVDSAVKKYVDSVSVKKDNSVTTTEKQDDYKKVTEIEFDTAKKYPVDAADYFPPVKRIKITETGIKKEKITNVVSVSDSTRKKELSNTDLSKNIKTDYVKTETVRTKNVQKKSYWGWMWIGLIIAGIIALYIIGRYYGWWVWFIALFKKRKDDYPVKYTKYRLPKRDDV